ncbi:NPH3 domain [Sesbania bispinosa]|nr:NPH3 domain [Sesbania bispinosa]
MTCSVCNLHCLGSFDFTKLISETASNGSFQLHSLSTVKHNGRNFRRSGRILLQPQGSVNTDQCGRRQNGGGVARHDGGRESVSCDGIVFQRIVGIEASMVLRSCLTLLPDAETTASLASRCIEALVWENDDDVSSLDVVLGVHPQDFETVVHSLNGRLPNHDVLYKMVDLYLKENKHCKLTEEQKTEICNSIDCTKLSPESLHLNTRRSVVAAAAATGAQQQVEPSSLGDTARRQTAQLKEVMDSTYSRIQSLEKELRGLKKILLDHQAEHEEEMEKEQRNILNSERSASFHFVPAESRKIQRGGRGSVSSSGFVLDTATKTSNEVNYSVGPCRGAPKMTRTFRHRFITGLKNAFRISN